MMDDLRDKYLQGTLSESEKKAFEAQLSNTEKEELAFELGVKDELKLKKRKEIRDQLARFEDSIGKQRRINPIYWSVAASVLIAASLVFYFTDEASLFDEYYEVYLNYEVTVLRGEDELSSRQMAFSFYDSGDYNQAVEVFNNLDALQTSDYFFRGVSHIQLEDYKAAIDDFRFVLDAKDENYSSASKWYTALIFVKLQNEEEAASILNELSQGKSEFAENARELVKKL